MYTMRDPLRRAEQLFAGREAVVCGGVRRSYGELAARIGKPGAARAVGGALNRNPVAIVVPCHRILGAHGSLTGYAGGLERKQALLELEGALLA